MSDRVDVTVAVDTAQAEASIDAVKTKADKATDKWKTQRRIILLEIGQAVSAITQVWSSFTTMMRAMGGAIDPFFSQLIGMALSSVSMMISIATLMSSTVVGAGWGAVLMVMTLSVNAVMMAKLVKDKLEVMGAFNEINAKVKSVPTPSGLGGF